MSAPKGYSRLQIGLHWGVALLILAQFIFADSISHAFRAILRGEAFSFDPLVFSHIAGGFAVLAFALWRLVLRKSRGAPDMPAGSSALTRMAAVVTHGGLYLLMVLLPISGAIAWFGGLETAGEAHEVMKALLLALVGPHVVAALWHQFWLKDGLMLRMKRPIQ